MLTTTKTSLKSLLAELMQMPTVTADKANTKAALEWFKHQVSGLPLHTRDFTHNGYSALILTTRPTKKPKVLLHAHLDVAPGPPALFKLTERDGRSHGRGVFDMKLAVASYLKLLLELGDDLADYDLGVSLTTDEEAVGGYEGVRIMMKDGWRAGAVINPDSVHGAQPGWAIQTASKGTAKYRVNVKGEAGHGSRPWMYSSAINELMAFLGDLSTQFPAEPCGDPDHGHNTVSIGRIEGGEIVNQVAASAHADVDMRFMPGQTAASMGRLIQATAGRHPHTTITKLVSGEVVSIEPEHAEVRRLSSIITDVSGTGPQFVLSHGASESSYFADEGIPVLMFSPPGGGHHADDEWVSARGLDDFYQVIRRYVTDTAHIS
jgi:acetylornithine deacetylase